MPIPLFLHSQNEKGDDLVAQLVEHITFNDGVLGSSPNGITSKVTDFKKAVKTVATTTF